MNTEKLEYAMISSKFFVNLRFIKMNVKYLGTILKWQINFFLNYEKDKYLTCDYVSLCFEIYV